MKTFKTLTFGLFAGLLALTVVTLSNPISAEAAADFAVPTTIQTPADELTSEEIDGLLFMVEEEKLARDVYLTLYDEWGLRIFQNIARSEQTHMDAIRALLNTYDLVDPTEDKNTGVFANSELQDLYDKLVVTGSESLAEALRVGAEIEEIDILDLDDRIAKTDKANIQWTYENLRKGSENHLRAFVSTWERQTGETYTPQYLDKGYFDEIMDASQTRGAGGGRSNGGGGRGRSGSSQGSGNGRWG